MARHSIPDIIEQAEPRPERFRVPARPLAWNLVLSLRPEQWTKNLLIFAGLIFGQRLLDVSAVLTSIAAFVVFCALSGVVYLVNDVADREADRQHPLKRHRPIASGAVPIRVALVTAAALTAVALAAAFRLRFEFGVVATAYVVLPGGYGTLDELSECLTLVQTGKSRRIPIILVGGAFWQGLLDWLNTTVAAEGMIGEHDVGLMRVIDDPDAVVEAIFDFYENRGFQPSRDEREKLLNL